MVIPLQSCRETSLWRQDPTVEPAIARLFGPLLAQEEMQAHYYLRSRQAL